MPVPRGKMLGGSSAINYMAYVRGHPGDFDAWAKAAPPAGATTTYCPISGKARGCTASADIAIDAAAHSSDPGPLGVSVRSPISRPRRNSWRPPRPAGFTRGDYNGRDRGGAAVTSLFQTTTREGKRSSTYHAFLEGETEQRPNLTIITHAVVTHVILEGIGAKAAGLPHQRGSNGEVRATKEVMLSAGAIGSPHLLMLSGIGPRRGAGSRGRRLSLDSAACRQAPERPHPSRAFSSRARRRAYSMNEIGSRLGPDVLRGPAARCRRTRRRRELVRGIAGAEARSRAASPNGPRPVTGSIRSSLYDAVAWFSTGLGDTHATTANRLLRHQWKPGHLVE